MTRTHSKDGQLVCVSDEHSHFGTPQPTDLQRSITTPAAYEPFMLMYLVEWLGMSNAKKAQYHDGPVRFGS